MKVIFLGGKEEGSKAMDYVSSRFDVVAGFVNAPFDMSILNRLGEVDLLIAYLYKHKVEEPLLSSPRLGCVNFHPGLLPWFGGACGYNIAILEGAIQYGCTAHFMTDKIDRGDIIESRRIHIDGEETAYSLAMRTYEEMYILLKSVCDSFEEGTVKRTPQENTRYMKWAEVDKLRLVQPEDDAEMTDRKIRAFYFPPYNGAEIEIKGEKYSIGVCDV